MTGRGGLTWAKPSVEFHFLSLDGCFAAKPCGLTADLVGEGVLRKGGHLQVSSLNCLVLDGCADDVQGPCDSSRASIAYGQHAISEVSKALTASCSLQLWHGSVGTLHVRSPPGPAAETCRVRPLLFPRLMSPHVAVLHCACVRSGGAGI